MQPGQTTNLCEVDGLRKTAIIDKELLRLQVDIAALQETRLADSGSVKEENFTFYWKGKPEEETREYGVGFAVRNSLLKMTEPPANGTERLLQIRLTTTQGPATIMSIYAPTLSATPETKDKFYDDLDTAIKNVPANEFLLLLGDFNARVGSDQAAWPTCLGHHGIGRMNENGQRLLELCCFHNLCVTNSFFQSKDCHKVSWRHLRSGHWHQLDLIITRRQTLNSVLRTRTYHSADCDTDHSLVCTKIRLQLKKMHHSKRDAIPRINTCSCRDPAKAEEFLDTLRHAFSAEDLHHDLASDKWDSIKTITHESAVKVFGKRNKKNADWFEASWPEMSKVTEAK